MKDLQQGSRHTRRLGQMLADGKIDVNLLYRLPIDVTEKPVLLAVVAQRYPETANKLLPLAKKLNFTPHQNMLCLNKVLREAKPRR
jgi:hypothetical protein